MFNTVVPFIWYIIVGVVGIIWYMTERVVVVTKTVVGL